MSAETTYRAALRWYPRAWRAANADAVLGTLLDETDAAGRDRASVAQMLTLIGHGCAARLGFDGASATAPSRARVGAVLLALGFVLALGELLLREWTPWLTSWTILRSYRAWGPFLSAGAAVPLVWLLAVGAALARRTTLARWALVVTAVLAIGLGIVGAAARASTPYDSFDPRLIALYGIPGLSWMVLVAVVALISAATIDTRVHALAPRALAVVLPAIVLMSLWECITNSWPILRQTPETVLGVGWVPVAIGAVSIVLALARPSWHASALVVLTLVSAYAVVVQLAQANADVIATVLGSGVLLLVCITAGAWLRGFRIRIERPGAAA